ncbi:MAG: hypothetical protein COW04_07515 [Deltaproteobacteria bacterium CG12_big_fil_rev_8_21_14_0_65_43_10]|nr:MAG: hypothetical protein AUK23_06695 [Deltaproteobacteria bacterium CG2_30_43_15]PIQ45476.1 MAG: hypothetical protein COW04_07515 [Deltaproteobacteria bacterium CG12_big_fil_rev_8_21_14_0_65_43_10]PIU85179.1 MAG: hypothetical protein COS67_09315 [Deltaproteobacteria bacterium CG06_land_8_20_14_3_00_44_19]PIX21933.1 MAG: hypothetical protein COZ68_13625 [Deltaproteobacteria bacterium CG_4_8_14_3_um_filter_43_13]PIZ18585.1 MAG: hypothetical protein COY50_14520 [Deltaproteobacteria bacterium C
MSEKDPRKLAEHLKGKKVLLMAGQLCEEVDFGTKKLVDYVVEISNRIGAPIAATGNTPLSLKAKGAKTVRKMWAAEVANYMRWPWEDPVIDEKPEILVLIGYGPATAQGLASAVRDGETMVLGNTYVKGATYSLPESPSLGRWQQALEEMVQSLA